MSNKKNKLTLHDYYKKYDINPIEIDLYNKKNLELHIKQRNNLYVNKLHLPLLIWKNSEVLEVGPANGENSLINAMNGANISVVEPNKEFSKNMTKLFHRYGFLENIRNIINKPIEDVKLKTKYDIIIAEGILSQLQDRKGVIRKLFSALSDNGLLIISTNDPSGSYIEYFKSKFFKEYTKGITDIYKLCELSKQFFYEDYMKLNTKRPYENWVKDVIISPLIDDFFLWGFDEIVDCLIDLSPIYYSSHPSYTIGTDYSWYKNVNKNDIKSIVESYIKKRHEFVMGEDKNNINDLCEEMIRVKRNPMEYKNCEILRNAWGTPNHYIVLRKNI